MTLSTKAEHEMGKEMDYVADEVALDVSPEGRAEDYVMSLEGSYCLRPIVDDPKWRARQLADEVEDEAESWARCYTDSASVAEFVAEEFGMRAYDAALAGLRESPLITVRTE